MEVLLLVLKALPTGYSVTTNWWWQLVKLPWQPSLYSFGMERTQNTIYNSSFIDVDPLADKGNLHAGNFQTRLANHRFVKHAMWADPLCFLCISLVHFAKSWFHSSLSDKGLHNHVGPARLDNTSSEHFRIYYKYFFKTFVSSNDEHMVHTC
jgi:hypothetical protein